MEWPIKYVDENGAVDSVINSDGKNLSVNLRGVLFEGEDLDMLSPEKNVNPKLLDSFAIYRNDLCNCRMELIINLPIQLEKASAEGLLHVYLELGKPNINGLLDNERLQLTLSYDNKMFKGSGRSGWFEDELLEIQKQLPKGEYMRACINCAYSDYSPYGHGLFGWMMCFKNRKQDYLKVKTKDQFWEVHDNYGMIMQETYLCNEFQLRIPGTGYRG